jgi:hypothetical protein
MAGKSVAKKLEIIQKPLLDRIRAGTPIRQACASVGLHQATFYDWMKKGELAVSGQHKEFYEAVEKAKADAVIESVLVIRKAAKDNWQAAAWFLERCHPDEFARDRQNVNVAIQNNTQVVVSENIKERIKKYETIFEDIES